MNEAEFLLPSLTHFPIRTEARYDEKLLAEDNAKQKCISCGAEPPSQNSHICKKKRAGNNGSQIFVVPQCQKCHREFEDANTEQYLEDHPEFRQKVILNIERQFAWLIEEYRKSH